MNEEVVGGLVGTFLVGFLVISLLCARKESELVGFYKSIGVTGRWYNVIMVLFFIGGIVYTIVYPILFFIGKLEKVFKVYISLGELFLYMLLGIGILLLVMFVYKRALNRVPEKLKKYFLRDVIIMFWGTMMKITLFIFAICGFLHWWSVRPRAYTVDGRTCYSYGNSDELYDENGVNIGLKNGEDEAFLY